MNTARPENTNRLFVPFVVWVGIGGFNAETVSKNRSFEIEELRNSRSMLLRKAGYTCLLKETSPLTILGPGGFL